MVRSNHHYVVELTAREDGRLLRRFPVKTGWESAQECVGFQASRAVGQLVPLSEMDLCLEPLWEDGMNGPRTRGFKLTLQENGNAAAAQEFSFTYFRQQARDMGDQLVKEGVLRAGEEFLYRLLAFVRQDDVPTNPMPAFTVTLVENPTPLKDVCFAELSVEAEAFGEQTDGDMPVFIPQDVLEEIAVLSEQAGAVETGGVLIGHLCRDAGIPDLGVLITAQIPARHTEGAIDKLVLTSNTWAAVRAAIELRGRDELILSWWHSHPAKHWCSVQCPPDRRRQCPLTTMSFFSADDVCLQETVFPKAFHSALVVTLTDEDPRHALFGWRQGKVCQRGFHILRSARPLRATEATSTPIGEPNHDASCSHRH